MVKEVAVLEREAFCQESGAVGNGYYSRGLDGLFRRSPLVSRKPDGIADVLWLQVFVYLWPGEGSVTSEQQTSPSLLVSPHNRPQDLLPALSAMHIAWPQHCPLTITELVENEERIIVHAFEVAVVGCPFLFPINRALRAIHVQDGLPVWGLLPWPGLPTRGLAAQPRQVLLSYKDLSLKAAQGVGGPPASPGHGGPPLPAWRGSWPASPHRWCPRIPPDGYTPRLA